jgi:hypothetical protein
VHLACLAVYIHATCLHVLSALHMQGKLKLFD